MSDNLSIKITADVVDLQAKMAIAKAELSSFTSEMNKLARAATSNGAGAAINTQMLQAAQGVVTARSRVNELTDSLGKAGEHVGGLREINMAIREIASGEVTRLPFTFTKLSQEFAGLGIEGLAAVAGVGALGAGLFELEKHAIDTESSLQKLQGSLAFTGTAGWVQEGKFVDELREKIAALPGQTEKSATEMVDALGHLQGSTKEQATALAELAPQIAVRFGKASDGVKDLAQQLNAIQEGPTFDVVNKFADSLNVAGASGANLTSILDKIGFGEAIVEGGAQGAQLQVDALKEKLDGLKTALSGLRGSSVSITPKDDQLATFRLQVAQMEADFKGSHTAMLAESVKMWQGETQAAGLSTAQQREVALGLAEAQKALNAAVAEDAKTQANKALEAQKQAARQAQQIDKDVADTTITLSKIRVRTERDTLDQQYQLGKVSAQQKGAILTSLAEEEYKIDLQRLDDELSTLDETTVAWQQTADRIRILMAQHQADLAKINRQITLDSQHSAQQDVGAWKTAVNEITSAESSLVSNILNGRQKMGQSLLQVAGRLVQEEIANDIKYYTMRALLGNTDAATQKARESAGLLVHMTTEAQAAAATGTGQAAQVAAVEAGEQAKVAAKAAGAVESKAVSAAVGSSTVMADAAKAAAGAYSAVAGIPYVGPVLAPIAAGVAFTAVAGYESLASSAGGDWNVDSTRLNIVHARETIMPAAVATPMRQFFENGGAQGGGGGDTYHVTQNLNISTMDGASVTAHANRFSRVYAKAITTELTRSQSLRGNY